MREAFLFVVGVVVVLGLILSLPQSREFADPPAPPARPEASRPYAIPNLVVLNERALERLMVYDEIAKADGEAGADVYTDEFVPRDGSAFLLLGWERYGYGQFAPTFAEFFAQIRGMGEWSGLELTDDELRELWGYRETRSAWYGIQEHRAFRHFVKDHPRRELARWRGRRASSDLTVELQRASRFIDAQFDDPAEFWGEVSSYSEAVINQIHEHGEYTEAKAAPEGEFSTLHESLLSGVRVHSWLMDSTLRSLR